MITCSVSRIEALESRIAPAAAAMVVVDFTAGVLSLTGDAGDHEFSITALGDGTTELKGMGGTLFKMGTAPDTDTLRLAGAIKSIAATLGAGADTVSVVGLSVGGDVAIDLGGGTNALTIDGLTAKGGLAVNGGSAGDTVTFAKGNVVAGKNVAVSLGDGANIFKNDAAMLKAAGNFTYTGLAGEDTVTFGFGSVRVGGSATFTLGAGDAMVNMPSTTPLVVGKALLFDSTASVAGDAVAISLRLSSATVGTDLVFNSGAGDETFAFAPTASKVGGAVRWVSGAGSHKVNGFFSGFAAKSIEVDATGSAQSEFDGNLTSVKLPGGMKFKGGADKDDVSILSFSGQFGALTANLGEGSNSVSFQAFNGKLGPFSGSGGAGNDSVSLYSYGGSFGSVTADLGDGDNSLLTGTVSGKFGPVGYTGGMGEDTLTVRGGFGSFGTVTGDLGDGDNDTEIDVNSGVIGAIQITGGNGLDEQSIGVASAKVAGGIVIRNGDGQAETKLFMQSGAVIPGGLRLESGVHLTNSAQLNVIGANSTLGGIDFMGGDGDSSIAFQKDGQETNGLTITGTLRLTGGTSTTGNAFIDLTGATNLTVKKGIIFDAGAGTGGLIGTVANLVTSGIKVTGNDNTNTVSLHGTGSLGTVTLDLGDGLNTVFIGLLGGLFTAKSFSITSTTTSSTEAVALSGVRVLGNFSAIFGAGVSSLSLDNTTVGGTFLADTGGGADIVSLDTGTTGAGVVLSKAAIIRLGEGDDTLNLGGPDIASLLTTKATFKADGGAGTDTLNNDPDNNFAQPPVFTSLP